MESGGVGVTSMLTGRGVAVTAFPIPGCNPSAIETDALIGELHGQLIDLAGEVRDRWSFHPIRVRGSANHNIVDIPAFVVIGRLVLGIEVEADADCSAVKDFSSSYPVLANRLTPRVGQGDRFEVARTGARRLTSLLDSLHSPSMKATITSKGQITIPLPIRKRLNLHTGTVLEFDEHADCLKATKAIDPERMRSVIGIAREELATKTTLGWLEELRGPVQLPPRKP
jgi:AbrB family looped-hinge helix DNA binding protein